MKAKTELLLYHLFWVADMVLTPSRARIGESFESWAYHGGFLRQIHELERRGLIESSPIGKGAEKIHRLTQKGMLLAIGGHDPVERWQRDWDGQWRIAAFDLPETKRSLRKTLRTHLRAARFGCLQGSVWITPDSVEDLLGGFMKKCGEQSRALLFFTGRPSGGAGDADLIAAAWNFEAISNAYKAHMAHLETLPRGGDDMRQHLLDWGKQERELWSQCMSLDPLLPRALWPRKYLGERAWKARLHALKSAGSLAQSASAPR